MMVVRKNAESHFYFHIVSKCLTDYFHVNSFLLKLKPLSVVGIVPSSCDVLIVDDLLPGRGLPAAVFVPHQQKPTVKQICVF